MIDGLRRGEMDGLGQDCRERLVAEEPAFVVAGFDDAVGVEQEAIAGFERQGFALVSGAFDRREKHAVFGNFTHGSVTEETGFVARGEFIDLGVVRQASGKLVNAWAFEGDCDPSELMSNFCEIEWPPRSGKKVEIPEVDRGAWFLLADARRAILKSQQAFLDVLEKKGG
jgi:predicted NUDIX family NTP pyrophosphohydrolase